MSANCYNCKHHSNAFGSGHHVTCQNPIFGMGRSDDAFSSIVKLFSGQIKMDGVKINPHGYKNGWAYFPMNFDPIWITCEYFEENEKEAR